jgi:hypothetical protein
MEEIKLNIAYLEDMFLEGIILLVRNHSREQLTGQLKYLWDIGSDMEEALNTKDEYTCHRKAKRLLGATIEESILSDYCGEAERLKVFLWETYLELKQLRTT